MFRVASNVSEGSEHGFDKSTQNPHKKSEEHNMGQHTHPTNRKSDGSEANQDCRTKGRKKMELFNDDNERLLQFHKNW